jgi:hypothetical protein
VYFVEEGFAICNISDSLRGNLYEKISDVTDCKILLIGAICPRNSLFYFQTLWIRIVKNLNEKFVENGTERYPEKSHYGPISQKFFKHFFKYKF